MWHVTSVCSKWFTWNYYYSFYFFLTKPSNTYMMLYTVGRTWNRKKATQRIHSVSTHDCITSCKKKKKKTRWFERKAEAEKERQAEGKWEVDARCAQLKWHGNWSRVHREGMCLMKCNNTVPVGPPPFSQPVNQWVCFMVAVPLLHCCCVVLLSTFGCLTSLCFWDLIELPNVFSQAPSFK